MHANPASRDITGTTNSSWLYSPQSLAGQDVGAWHTGFDGGERGSTEPSLEGLHDGVPSLGEAIASALPSAASLFELSGTAYDIWGSNAQPVLTTGRAEEVWSAADGFDTADWADTAEDRSLMVCFFQVCGLHE